MSRFVWRVVGSILSWPAEEGWLTKYNDSEGFLVRYKNGGGGYRFLHVEEEWLWKMLENGSWGDLTPEQKAMGASLACFRERQVAETFARQLPKKVAAKVFQRKEIDEPIGLVVEKALKEAGLEKDGVQKLKERNP